jgi:hypothetical protein
MVCRCGIIFNSTKAPIRSVVTEWPVYITDSDILRSQSYTVLNLHSREACYELRVGQPIVGLHFAGAQTTIYMIDSLVSCETEPYSL